MSSALLSELPQKRRLVDVVDEGPLAVDLEYRQPLPVARLELLVARDVDRVVFDAEAVELRPRPLAEAAAVPVEERDPRDRARASRSPRRPAGRTARTPPSASRSCAPRRSPTSRRRHA